MLPVRAARHRQVEHQSPRLHFVGCGGCRRRLENGSEMAHNLDASLSVFVNILGVLVFASITLYHVLTANRKDITS